MTLVRVWVSSKRLLVTEIWTTCSSKASFYFRVHFRLWWSDRYMLEIAVVYYLTKA